MNEMRKLMEAVDLDDKAGRNHPASLNPQEYKAFAYGVAWGNAAQYDGGGYGEDDLPEAYRAWVEEGRPGYHDDLDEGLYGSDADDAFVSGYERGYEDCRSGDDSDAFGRLDDYKMER